MAIDGKILARAKTALEEKRRRRDELFERRLEKVYARVPRVRALDNEIRATMSELVGFALNSAGSGQVEDIRQRNLDLQEQRRKTLIGAGFSERYLSDDYMCPKCNDTGFIGSGICACLMKLYKEAQKESLSNLLKLGDETFDSFNLSYYSDAPDPDSDKGLSPRRSMEVIYETCVEYARKFGDKSMNLFFKGKPGLGKTFLSACIARVVSDNGHSVVYDTATSVFAIFENARFSRADDLEEVRSEVKRRMECDLLIIDDLGTEMTTSFTVSALYEIINTRLVTGHKTIVSSNLTIDELRAKYSEQIMSRLEWEYQVLSFCGDDIRRRKNVV